MSIIKYAVEGVGKDILFIKDNKVVGKGKSHVAYGDVWVGASYLEGEFLEKFKLTEHVKAMSLKHTYLRFCPILGVFIGDDKKFGSDIVDIFEDVRVVDEFNFRWGMVPDTFKDVPGYRSAPTEYENKE